MIQSSSALIDHGSGGGEGRLMSWAIPIALSVIGHVALMAGLVWFQDIMPRPRLDFDVIDVSLVSLPDLSGGGGPGPALEPASEKPEPAPEKPPEPEKAPEPEPEPEPEVKVPKPEPEPVKAPEPVKKTAEAVKPPPDPDAVSLSRKTEPPKPKVSLKKKTYQPERAVSKAIDRIEKDVKATERNSVKSAIDSLREKVAREEALKGIQSRVSGEGQGGGPAGVSPGGRRALQLIDIYKAEIAYLIQQNWAFSEQLAGGRKDLATTVMVKIMPDGEIRDVWFERRSGNRHLDESALKAIQKSNPLPPLPPGFTHYDVGMVFTPSGLGN